MCLTIAKFNYYMHVDLEKNRIFVFISRYKIFQIYYEVDKVKKNV